MEVSVPHEINRCDACSPYRCGRASPRLCISPCSRCGIIIVIRRSVEVFRAIVRHLLVVHVIHAHQGALPVHPGRSGAILSATPGAGLRSCRRPGPATVGNKIASSRSSPASARRARDGDASDCQPVSRLAGASGRVNKQQRDGGMGTQPQAPPTPPSHLTRCGGRYFGLALPYPLTCVFVGVRQRWRSGLRLCFTSMREDARNQIGKDRAWRDREYGNRQERMSSHTTTPPPAAGSPPDASSAPRLAIDCHCRRWLSFISLSFPFSPSLTPTPLTLAPIAQAGHNRALGVACGPHSS